MPKTILLADDSITIQKVVELTFSDGDYEVVAVNNGAKAVQKLAEMRPDIILSDIIMPEKNGYEVCEYVKSHPEFRAIPVVLLTGTFEPFDPDRAEKAGCDAVVTKPFESQSLIHKVEELISNAKSAATTEVAPLPTAPPVPEPETPPSPWLDEEPSIEPPPPVAAPPLFSSASGPVPVLDEEYTHDADIFNAPAQPAGSADLPFETPADLPAESPFGAPPEAEQFSGETRAFPQMNFDELQKLNATPEPPPAAEPSPWDEPADLSGETQAFGKMSFDELQQMAAPPMPEPEPEPEPELSPEPMAETESPFGAPPEAEQFSGETRAFPRMTWEDIQRMEAAQAQPAPEPEPEFTPEPEAPPQSAESLRFDLGPVTRAVPELHIEQPAPEPEPEPAPEPSPWDEQPEPMFSGETQAFPKMSFDELQQMASAAPQPEPESAPWDEPAEPAQPAWSTSVPEPEPVEQQAWSQQPEEPAWSPEPEPEPAWAPAEEEPPVPIEASAPPAIEELPAAEPEAIAEAEEPPVPPPALAPEATPAIPIAARELTDEQVDRIARRVVELMSDQVVRNIAWEVIPDLAEMVVKERIRQLESEA